MNIQLENLDVHPDILQKLMKANIPDVNWVIFHSLSDIQLNGKLSKSQASTAKQACIRHVFQLKPTSAYNMLSNTPERIPTGCSSIDEILGGGLLCQGITELTGESACGKTQICLQTALHSQLAKRNGRMCSSLYICTEDLFPSQRLLQLEACVIASQQSLSPGYSFSRRVYVEHCSDHVQLIGLLENRAPMLLNKGQTNLIILDSVTALFRGQDVELSPFARSNEVQTVGRLLHQLASRFKICILCVNQVSANMKEYSKEKSIPALGLTWANLVTTRLQVTRPDMQSGTRLFHIKFAPHLNNDTCQYTITQGGVMPETN